LSQEHNVLPPGVALPPKRVSELECSKLEPDELEPNELARRAQTGCADAFAELSRRFRPRLIRLVEPRVGHCRADAEDVAQESLARAFDRIKLFDARGQFSTWLYTIALRQAVDHARRVKRRPQLAAMDIDSFSSNHSDAATAAQQRDEAENLWALAQDVLPEPQHTAMWLRYGEDLSPAEIARVMGRTRIGVGVLLHRARNRLAAALCERDGERDAERSHIFVQGRGAD
jgi:RNA polymerase sigma-70 factor, ECF subfamily